MTSEKILGFMGKNAFLSNMYLVDLYIPDESGKITLYRSVEHYYMSQKTDDPVLRQQIIDADTPYKAKRLGTKMKLRPGWLEHHRISVMNVAISYKFEIPEVWKLLAATGDAYLEETNHWNDKFWGVCDGEGKNNLGKMIMFYRSLYRIPNVQSF